MIDELTFDKPFNEDRQEQLIRQYCHGIDERIRRSTSKEEAERIVQDTCQGFDRACESDLVRTFLKRYVNDLFAKRWSRPS